MAEFTVERIAPKAWAVLDEGQSSFYIVEGEDRAAVIDTGITPGEAILPVARRCTQKDLVLLLTHAHPDHMHHMDEFAEVYLSHREFELPEEILKHMCAGKDLALRETKNLFDGRRIPLGGCDLEIVEVAGHTPGSVVLYDARDELLFTGDAIGSGAGVWLQLDGCLPLEAYALNLRRLLSFCVERGAKMRFYGGHHAQPFTSKWIVGYNPLSLGLLCDLIELVEQLCSGDIVGRPCDINIYRGDTRPLYAAYGRAEIIYNPHNIRR